MAELTDSQPGELRRPGFPHMLDSGKSSDLSKLEGEGVDSSSNPEQRFKELTSYVRTHVIGFEDAFNTPFGSRRISYCDFTASGRGLSFIEDYIRQEVLPVYGNTHTSTSFTGIQTTLIRQEARLIVGRCLNASKDDEVLFTGSGTTAAVNTLVKILFPHKDPDRKSSVVVFVGPYEHHSNLLPWRETGATIIRIQEDFEGKDGLDLADLENKLKEYRDFSVKIGAFNAVSNITGVLTNVESTTHLLHQYGALSFWDYAAGAPYLSIDMNPVPKGSNISKELFEKDAIYLSPHKLIGGVGTSGVLIVKKRLLASRLGIPTNPGGGTVFYVTENSHRYLDNFQDREEGGTPNIISGIRTGLVFQLHESLGFKRIESEEFNLSARVHSRLSRHPNVTIYGNSSTSRLPIISFNIKHESRGLLYLHYNFVCLLLNDLFGIQARGGCMCAGPYGQRLLGIDENLALDIERQLLLKNEILRPGFVRLSFTFFMTLSEVDFILSAVEFIASHGWKFLPLYAYRIETGEWSHRKYMSKMLDRRWLGDISYGSGTMKWSSSRKTLNLSNSENTLESLFESYLRFANQYVSEEIDSRNSQLIRSLLVDQSQLLTEECQKLRWFLLPSEAQSEIHGDLMYKKHVSPFNSQCINLGAKRPLPNPVESLEPTPHLSTQGESGSPKRNKGELDSKEQKTNLPCRNCFHRHTNDDSLTASTVPECVSCRCVDYAPCKEKDKHAIRRCEKKIKHFVGRAFQDYKMINEGDRILVALSGGKDSLTLLHILLLLQRRSPVKFDVGACTIDPQHPEYDPSRLKHYLASINVPYFYEEKPIMNLAKIYMDPKNVSICSFCARMKRGMLYGAARREGYNVIAMGQHLDDLAESFLMSAFHNGKLKTMKANYHVDEGDLRIIRPLVYVRERLTRQFASLADLPIVNENCPACWDEPKERARIKQVLAAQEHLHPSLFSNLLKTMLPLIAMENRTHCSEEQLVRSLVEQLRQQDPQTYGPVSKKQILTSQDEDDDE